MKNTIFILYVLFSLSLNAQLFNPQSKEITEKFFPDNESILNTTPALQKKRGYTNYKELIDFLNNLTKNHPDKISLSFVGESQKGKKIPMVKLVTTNTKDKIKVWMQGGLHGDEKASTEAMLYLLDRLLNDDTYKEILENVELAIVPMANIDGYLKNDRYAANGLDLNRDQTKLMAKESVVLKQAFSDFNPHVGVDFHEYRPYRRDFARMGDFGLTNMYDAMFLYSGNLNVPKNLRTLTESLFVENARQELNKYNYKHHPYISTAKVKGEIHINQGSFSARSSASNYALTNTISSLIEIRGVGLGKTSFKRRIHTAFVIAISYLKTASKNLEKVKQEIDKATIQTNDVVVESERAIYKDSVQFIDINSIEYVKFKMTVRDAWQPKVTLSRIRPKAYVIKANETEIIEKLKTLGVEITYLEEEKSLEVQAYKIKGYSKKPIPYEKTKLQTVKVDLIKNNITFPKGTVIVKMNQRRANIVPEVLEPEAPNSFVKFSILKTNQGETLPIYRLLN